MTEAEHLLRKFGAIEVKARRHAVFMLAGIRFALHRGKPNYQEIFRVKKQLRRLGLLK